MSGTSLDGLDLALIEQTSSIRLLATHYVPLPSYLREQLLALCSPGHDELARGAIAEQAWARLASDAIKDLLNSASLPARHIRAIGSHGQTVRHEPARGFTVQLSNPALLAELTGITVVSDFRRRDVAAGGQGAPLVPAFHEAVFAHPHESRAIVNIGGFSNLTLLASGKDTRGFDCGPGNVLLDTWIRRHQGAAYDEGGRWAAGAQADDRLLQHMLADAFFSCQGPKSTGRELFNEVWLDRCLAQVPGVAPQAVQATLAELTARTIADALQAHQPDTRALFVCGGGAHNAHLMTRLAALLPGCDLWSTARLGIDPDWVEAMAFAWLAHCCLERIPANRPAVTGARGLRVLGAIYPAG